MVKTDRIMRLDFWTLVTDSVALGFTIDHSISEALTSKKATIRIDKITNGRHMGHVSRPSRHCEFAFPYYITILRH